MKKKRKQRKNGKWKIDINPVIGIQHLCVYVVQLSDMALQRDKSNNEEQSNNTSRRLVQGKRPVAIYNIQKGNREGKGC